MYIASEVSQRLLPRVLLADEVGLGKTIEACLILHRLHLNGRASRILVLLPESLLHQWFVELLRRFNLWFELFDAERCAASLEADPQSNPFLDQQLLLCPIDALAKNECWSQLCAEAGWDLLVVDEAHHLEWSPEAVSPNINWLSRLAGGVRDCFCLRRHRSSWVRRGTSPACVCSIRIDIRIWSISGRSSQNTRHLRDWLRS